MNYQFNLWVVLIAAVALLTTCNSSRKITARQNDGKIAASFDHNKITTSVVNHLPSTGINQYAVSACPHDKLALAGYKNIGTQSAPKAAFLCVILPRLRFMAELEGDAFARAGVLCYQSANPLRFCHPHLAVNGKTSIENIGVHFHA